MKKVFSAGETYWCIVHSRPFKEGTDGATSAIMFYTGEGFLQSNPRSHMEAKLFKTKEEAENTAAALILTAPNLMGSLEVLEQVCPKDVWK